MIDLNRAVLLGAGVAAALLAGCGREAPKGAAKGAPAAASASGRTAPRWADYFGDASDEEFPEMAAIRAECRRVKPAEPPAGDRPDAKTAATLKDCDSARLWYGVGGPADPVKARQCAFAELDPETEQGLAGPAVLMMVYANGKGTKRDLDYATKMACSFGAPAEIELRVKRFQAMKASGKFEAVDYCDDVTSGFGGGQCAYVASAKEDDARDARLKAITAGWDGEGLALVKRLQKAQDDYASAHVDGEVDLSGTLRGAFAIEATDAIKEQTLDLLGRLAAGKGPAGTADTLAAADRELNAVYARVQAERQKDDKENAADELHSNVTATGLRDTERAWLKYRDAWGALARRQWPAASQEGVLQAVTEARVRQLKCMSSAPEDDLPDRRDGETC